MVGQRTLPFLYRVDWPEGTSASTLRRQGRDRLSLLPGVADRLVVLGPLLRPLIEIHWVRDVARWTGVQTEDEGLRAHLFGAHRVAFPPLLRKGLHNLQGGRCFYCGGVLSPSAQVDHFLAWSRWPNDAVENLVLADRCNGDKSDHLATVQHVDRWVTRLRVAGAQLHELAVSARWLSDRQRSFALVRSTYSHIAAGTPLWVEGRAFDEAEGPVEVSL